MKKSVNWINYQQNKNFIARTLWNVHDSCKILQDTIAVGAVKFCNFQTKFMEIFYVVWKNLMKFSWVKQNISMQVHGIFPCNVNLSSHKYRNWSLVDHEIAELFDRL